MYFTEDELEKCTAKKGDLLVCEGGDIGRSAIWNYDYDIRIQNHIHKLRAYRPICTRLFYYVLYLYKGIGNIGGKGIGIQGLSSGALHNILLPFPSLNEQQRIVSKIEDLIPIVDKYEKSQGALDKLNADIFEKLRKSVLQDAIQGKLVAQDSNDEPALVLLERIKEEKAELFKRGKLKKKDLIDSFILKGDDNKYYEQIGEDVVDLTDLVPFEIPDNWEWVRLRDICSICTGATFKKEEATQDQTGVRVLRGGNISPLRLCFKDDDIFIPGSLVKENILLNKNDIVTPAVTSLENIGKMARVESNLQNVTVGGFVFILRPFFNDDVMSKYLLAVMSSPSTIEYMRSITNKSGQAFYNIGKERLATTLIPVPPHNEQKCMTDKLNHLFSRL